MKLKLPFYKQKNRYTCGPASLQMVLEYFKHSMPQTKLAELSSTDAENGTDHSGMISAATEAGFYCYVNNDSSLEEIGLFLKQGLPVIVNFIEPSNNEGHYGVVTYLGWRNIVMHDPWNGKNFKIPKKDFLNRWYDSENKHKRWIMVLSNKDFGLGRQYTPTKTFETLSS